MSDIRPFEAIHFAPQSASGDVSTRLAPPYDVLDAQDKQRLLDRDPNNFVRIDLPHVPPKAAGPPQAYEQARRDFETWLDSGVLVRDERPALYAYHQRFEHEGRTYTRKMFFARLRIEPFGQGGVFPHEQTFGGPKEDRLALTKATQCNLSPIFGLYSDPQNEVAGALEQRLPKEPPLRGELDGTDNRVWAVSDTEAIDAVQRLMAEKAMYIADGHHRYGTAMLYRDWLAGRQGALPDDHPANFVLCVLCAMEDPGLLILPTHRVLPNVDLPPVALRESKDVEIAHLLADGPEQVPQALEKFGPQALAMAHAGDDGFYMLRPNQPDLLDRVAPERSEAWRRLALAFLHAYVLDGVVRKEICGGQPPKVEYVKSATAAVNRAKQSNGTAFLMQATTMSEMRAVCGAGDLMPQKSTFFYPKLASGLVVNALE